MMICFPIKGSLLTPRSTRDQLTRHTETILELTNFQSEFLKKTCCLRFVFQDSHKESSKRMLPMIRSVGFSSYPYITPNNPPGLFLLQIHFWTCSHPESACHRCILTPQNSFEGKCLQMSNVQNPCDIPLN